jgi:hypothetical protein
MVRSMLIKHYLISSSLTLDLKFPYHGRNPPHRGGSRPTGPVPGMMTGPGGGGITFGYYVDSDHVEVGNGDIYIDENMMEVYSELEGCYGLGLQRQTPEVAMLMGGSNNFPIDELEVWMIQIPTTAAATGTGGGGNSIL